MSLLLLYGLLFGGFLLSAVYLTLEYRRSHYRFKRARKVIALLGGLFYAATYSVCNPAVAATVRLTEFSPFGDNGFLTAVSVLLIWLSVPATLTAVLYPFAPHRTVGAIVKWASTVISLADIALLFAMKTALLGDRTDPLSKAQLIFFALSVGLTLTLCLSVWLSHPQIRFRPKRLLFTSLWFLSATAISFPAYTFLSLFGKAPVYIRIIDLTPSHRIMLYFGIALGIGIYLLFRKKAQSVKRFALIYISFATLLTFTYQYTIADYASASFWPAHIPFHICCTAMYLIPLCLIFRMKRLYYFTFFINVIGAFFAMTMPNYDEGLNLFSTQIVVFWVNHFCALGMPLLLMALGEFKRPKLKQFYYSTVAFACYFLLVLILNAWFTNFTETDYFFINSDFIADKLGSAVENIRNIQASFSLGGLSFVFYPVYQVLFFICYVAFTVCMWFLYEQCFSVVDLYADMARRQEKIKLDRLALLSQLDGRSMEEPLYMQETEQLILSHVSKRYGSSSVFAVKDANLEVHGGEIFGFLGPNGAGKSTIIKSIVGIQPITSGEIRICGFDAEKQPVQAKRQLGFVPDHYELYENLTGRDYINYIADLYRVDKETRTARIDRYVSLFQLEGSFDNPMKTYSHGMKQKIAIMAALVHNPKIWILDEPLTGLDPDSIFQVKECMKQHAKEGNIVFFSSHIIDVVERICDRIAIIRKGEILACHTMKEIEASDTGLEAYYMKTINGRTVETASQKQTPAAVGEKTV